MIQAHPSIPTSAHALARVRNWLASTEQSKAQIAAAAGVDEKTVRLAYLDTWNPTANTLQKFESIIPDDWKPAKRRSAA